MKMSSFSAAILPKDIRKKVYFYEKVCPMSIEYIIIYWKVYVEVIV